VPLRSSIKITRRGRSRLYIFGVRYRTAAEHSTCQLGPRPGSSFTPSSAEFIFSASLIAVDTTRGGSQNSRFRRLRAPAASTPTILCLSTGMSRLDPTADFVLPPYAIKARFYGSLLCKIEHQIRQNVRVRMAMQPTVFYTACELGRASPTQAPARQTMLAAMAGGLREGRVLGEAINRAGHARQIRSARRGSIRYRTTSLPTKDDKPEKPI
jgi:hypothetical protein